MEFRHRPPSGRPTPRGLSRSQNKEFPGIQGSWKMQPKEGPNFPTGQPQYQLADIPNTPAGDGREAVDHGQPEPCICREQGHKPRCSQAVDREYTCLKQWAIMTLESEWGLQGTTEQRLFKKRFKHGFFPYSFAPLLKHSSPNISCNPNFASLEFIYN